MPFAEKIAREKGVVITDEAKSSSAAMSTWIERHLGTEGRKHRRKTVSMPPKSTMPKLKVSKKQSGTRRRSTNPCTMKLETMVCRPVTRQHVYSKRN
jgi:hypothetical protein